MTRLILARHGTSEYNKIGKWTGITDVELAPEGYDDARRMGEMIKDIDICHIHVSKLKRAHQTLDEIKKVLEKDELEIHCHEALNERDYGVHTGKNKWQVKEDVGEDEFRHIRRGWDTEILEGENLKDVYERVVPYYKNNIHPQLLKGDCVLVVAHGNSLRALIKHLENVSDEDAPNLEFNFGEVHCYDFNQEGNILSKEILGEGYIPNH